MRLSLFLHLECFHKYASTWREKKSHFHYCENASISTMLSHCSGFYLEAEEKMKCIAVRIWHFEFDRESPMASFEETDAAASVQSTNRLLYTWSFEKIIQKNKVNTHQRFKLLMWCSQILPDYSLRLLGCRTALCCRCEIIWIQTGQTRRNHLDLICVSSHESVSIFITLSSVHLLENLSPLISHDAKMYSFNHLHIQFFHLFSILSLNRFLLLPIFTLTPSHCSTSFHSFLYTSFIRHNQENVGSQVFDNQAETMGVREGDGTH